MTDSAHPPGDPAGAHPDVVIVGAGFAGLYLLHRLRKLGFCCRVYEAAADVGGTWYWNRYPGARCDIESVEYSYSFSPELEQEWDWTERYASQPEILHYLRHVADRFDLRRDIRFETRVTAATFQSSTGRWSVETDSGESVQARWMIMATGCLSVARLPDIAGRDRFTGHTYHSGNWPLTPVDFSGKRVAVIGTGSTAIQLIPEVARQAAEVLVFQRTANFSLPARNRPLSDDDRRAAKARYREIREAARRTTAGVAYFPVAQHGVADLSADECERLLEAAWQRGGTGLGRTFTDTLTRPESNQVVAEFVRRKIRERVGDPALAEKVVPRDHPIGTKRVCLDSGYFETLMERHVSVIDAHDEPIVAITETGVRTRAQHYPVDAIVFATGFDAMTGALLAIDIRTEEGLSLRDCWAAGPVSYLGLAIAGFPNLFTVTGPGSPSVLSNMVVSIEQHVEWISDCLGAMRDRGFDRIEATGSAQSDWVSHVNAAADRTLLPGVSSWYTGANVPGKPRVFMPYVGGVAAYRDQCDAVARAGYEGFILSTRSA